MRLEFIEGFAEALGPLFGIGYYAMFFLAVLAVLFSAFLILKREEKM